VWLLQVPKTTIWRKLQQCSKADLAVSEENEADTAAGQLQERAEFAFSEVWPNCIMKYIQSPFMHMGKIACHFQAVSMYSLFICVCVCVCVCIYIYIHTHTQMHTYIHTYVQGYSEFLDTFHTITTLEWRKGFNMRPTYRKRNSPSSFEHATGA